MTANDIFDLRRKGLTTEAYETARQLYAADKSVPVSLAMFWTAVDMLKQHVATGKCEEARKILLALQRLLPKVPDKEGWMHTALERCEQQIGQKYEKSSLLGKKSEHTQMGTWGEEMAAEYLRDKGYVILERDWHSGHRDIDIIARRDECIVFVEVKTRRNRDFSDPVTAVDHRKQRNLRNAINHYLQYRHIDVAYRFDIITVVGKLYSSHPEIMHIEDVDIVELRRRR